MSVLKAYFDKNVNQASPVQEDFERVVRYDEDGNEIISFEPVDYPALQRSLGTVEMWSLNALLKAGIDPSFPIRTGLNTRLEGVDTISGAEAILDSFLASQESNE